MLHWWFTLGVIMRLLLKKNISNSKTGTLHTAVRPASCAVPTGSVALPWFASYQTADDIISPDSESIPAVDSMFGTKSQAGRYVLGTAFLKKSQQSHMGRSFRSV